VAAIASRLRWPGQSWDAFRGRTAIERHRFPEKLRRTVAGFYEPELTEAQTERVFEGLRSWFLVCLYAGGKKVGMPSEVVDHAWHEYILRTKDYQQFCERAFDRYLHHDPDAADGSLFSFALARTLRILDEYPDARRTEPEDDPIPLLFALDNELGVDEGYDWTEDHVEQLRAVRSDEVFGITFPACGTGGGGCGGGGD
jgi:hypothetical protein